MAMRLIILGSASGYPTAKRTNSGYILDIDDSLILFDCGSGVTRAFMQARLNPHLLNNIIISHTHPDHISDLPQMVQMMKLFRKTGTVNIYLPDEALEPIGNYLKTCYLYQEGLPFELRLRPVVNSWKIDETETTIRSIANNHLGGHARLVVERGYFNKTQSYSYALSSGGKRIFYSGDIKSLEDIISHLDDLDLLLIETTHFSVDELFEIAAVRDIKKIVLTHIADEKEDEIKMAVENNKFGLELILARDGEIIIL